MTTKTAQFTPGPWTVSAGRVITTSSGQFYLTYGKDKYGNPLFKDFVELDNNAHLIAAAPAMYEALQHAAASNHHPACKARGEYSSQPEKYCTCHVQKARAALAQAEGR